MAIDSVAWPEEGNQLTRNVPRRLLTDQYRAVARGFTHGVPALVILMKRQRYTASHQQRVRGDGCVTQEVTPDGQQPLRMEIHSQQRLTRVPQEEVRRKQHCILARQHLDVRTACGARVEFFGFRHGNTQIRKF